MIKGVYRIINIPSGKVYIGSSNNVEKRIAHHRSMLKKGNHVNSYLQRAWNKHGEGNFSFNLIEECEEEVLSSRENYYITKYKSGNRRKGYNLILPLPDGRRKLHPTTRKKIGDSLRGRKLPESVREKMRGPKKNKRTKEHTQKITNANRRILEERGYFISEEGKKKLSKVNKGKSISEETINKIKESIKERKERGELRNVSNERKSHMSKPIIVETFTGERIGEFSSQKEAASKLNIHRSQITDYLRGKRICKKYIWKYKFAEDRNRKNSESKSKLIRG